MLTGNGETIALGFERDAEALLSGTADFGIWLSGPQRLKSTTTALEGLRALLGDASPTAVPQARQWRTYLIALDGASSGASYRDIALRLYGEPAVKRQWRDPSRRMKDTVRYAVRRGRNLMEGGYHQMLERRAPAQEPGDPDE